MKKTKKLPLILTVIVLVTAIVIAIRFLAGPEVQNTE